MDRQEEGSTIKQKEPFPPPWEGTKSPRNKKNLLLSLPKIHPCPSAFPDLVNYRASSLDFTRVRWATLAQVAPTQGPSLAPAAAGRVQPVQFPAEWRWCLCSWQIIFRDVHSLVHELA